MRERAAGGGRNGAEGSGAGFLLARGAGGSRGLVGRGGGVLALGALLALAPGRAGAEPRVVPLVGAELARTHERLELKLPGYEGRQDRGLWGSSLLVGLRARLAEGPRAALRADATLSYGGVFHTGHGRLALRGGALVELPLGAGFALLAGAGPGVVVDVTRRERSAVELALPLGLRFRALELLYRPALVLPLGAEETAVFGGERALGARPGLAPFTLELRVRLEGLGFGGSGSFLRGGGG